MYFPILLILLAMVIFLAPMLGREETIPNAGLCDLDKTKSSERIAAYLTDNGYIICEDEHVMREMIQDGILNCGLIIPEGFEELMYADSLDDTVIFISSPLSYSPEIYQSHAAAAIFGELAPIITATQLDGTGITAAESVGEYHSLTDSGLRFSFLVETVNTVASPQDERASTYLLGAASLFIFAVLMYAACDLLSGDIRMLAPRIGMGKTVLHAVIPGMVVRVIGVMLSALTAAFMSWAVFEDTLILSLLVPLCVYTLYIAAFAIFAAALFADTAKMQIFTFFILIPSLILCPIYVDMSLTYRWISIFRILIPTYQLWIYAEHPLSAVIVPIAAAVSLGALYLRFSKKPIS